MPKETILEELFRTNRELAMYQSLALEEYVDQLPELLECIGNMLNTMREMEVAGSVWINKELMDGHEQLAEATAEAVRLLKESCERKADQADAVLLAD